MTVVVAAAAAAKQHISGSSPCGLHLCLSLTETRHSAAATRRLLSSSLLCHEWLLLEFHLALPLIVEARCHTLVEICLERRGNKK